ncbi:hypothetical protein BLGI_1086 [Brevibacillus laterosporus GI-9]|nr:hypothetical protein BLGI_1086 [Brevibacillus laterosporus GI-9]
MIPSSPHFGQKKEAVNRFMQNTPSISGLDQFNFIIRLTASNIGRNLFTL